MGLTEITSAAEVQLASNHDPFARGSLRRAFTRGWVSSGAVGWIGTDLLANVPCFSALGEPAAVGALVTDLLGEFTHRQRVTLPRGSGAHLPAWVGLDEPTRWNFRYLTKPPANQPREERVFDGLDPQQVRALLTIAAPTSCWLPGHVETYSWVGIAGPNGLIACAADNTATSGVGHLCAITVHPQARRQGLGKVLVAALSRRLFAHGCDVVTLATGADNGAERGLYDTLGFADVHPVISGALVIRARW